MDRKEVGAPRLRGVNADRADDVVVPRVDLHHINTVREIERPLPDELLMSDRGGR
jgi:hypothetical protein